MLDALDQALHNQPRNTGPNVYSDQRAQFLSLRYITRLEQDVRCVLRR
jgi:hypothetical protein